MAADVSRIGVLGGAFNPPHVGHLLLAQEARWQLGLDRVLLMVTRRAPHKEIEDDPGAEVRLEMALLAAGGGGGGGGSGVGGGRGETSYSDRAPQVVGGGEARGESFFPP